MFFLSYAREDETSAAKLYRSLIESGANVWFDRARLRAGDIWFQEIKSAIHESEGMIVCLSDNAVGKLRGGYGVQREELTTALTIALNLPNGSFRIVPVRLNDCDRGPPSLRATHQIDLFDDWNKAIDDLLAVLKGTATPEEVIEEIAILIKVRGTNIGPVHIYREKQIITELWEGWDFSVDQAVTAIKQGDTVNIGDPLAWVCDVYREAVPVRSPIAGEVVEIYLQEHEVLWHEDIKLVTLRDHDASTHHILVGLEHLNRTEHGFVLDLEN